MRNTKTGKINIIVVFDKTKLYFITKKLLYLCIVIVVLHNMKKKLTIFKLYCKQNNLAV